MTFGGGTGTGLHSRVAASLAALSLTALAACDSVLGLDPPTLDPCAASPCLDASSDGSVDASADARADAKSDAETPSGIRCGGGTYPESYCDDPTPLCCQTTTDAGGASYACVTDTSACDGYPIDCATDDDCPGSDVCCHFTSGMKCDGESSCSNDDLVCDPRSADDCPSGWSCDVVLVNDSQMSPYLGCSP